jgi:hypothetical protein
VPARPARHAPCAAPQAAACWLIEHDVAEAEAAWQRERAEAQQEAAMEARERQRAKAAIVARCAARGGKDGGESAAGAARLSPHMRHGQCK